MSTRTSSLAPLGADKLRADTLLQQGLVAHHRGDLTLAQMRCRECLALNSAHADAMLMLGVVRLAALDFAEAARLIEAAGTLTGWQSAPYRQNYGLLFSARIAHYDPVSGSAD